MVDIITALKALGKKCNTSQTEPTGDAVGDVIKSIATNFNINGAKGDTGAHVTAISLVKTEGVITGGTATLSDGTSVDITVTEG